MKMNKLATLLLTTTLTMASGAAFAADSTSQTNNGQANAAADAGQMAPDAKENVAPGNMDTGTNSGTNSSTMGTTGTTGTTGTSSGTMLHPQTNSGTTNGMNDSNMTKDEIHKNSQCKDGKCPDINEKVQTGDGINNDANTKTDGTTQ